MNTPSAPLTVSQLNQMVRGALENAFPPLWVEGELSGVRVAPSGHAYFTLKDESASVSCVAWRATVSRLRGLPPEGTRVVCAARLTVYEARGQYQLVVEDVEARGAGAAALRLKLLRERLEKEGLFDPARKRQLPPFPFRVGVVTSPSGAALHDIIEVFRLREAPVSVVLSPALVQGEGAPDSLVAALRLLEEQGEAELVILGRGGGSAEDLAAFNDERVVRAVASCALPVISAVGHQIDTTLTDLAADRSAPTPSAAAEAASPSGAELLGVLGDLASRLGSALGEAAELERRRLASLGARLVHPRHRLEQGRYRGDELALRLSSRLAARLAAERARLLRLAAQLDGLSPLAVLGRGYAILRRADGTVVRSPAQVVEGELLSARVAGGEFRVRKA